ncbi:MAG: metallophosphoesterase, partial [Dehalococcoidia bacterium]|nr:metallophosphoesterase [Dehalococcoidia bacterium]
RTPAGPTSPVTGKGPSKMPRERYVWFVLALTAPVLTAALLAWSLSFHNTAGLFRVSGPARAVLVLVVLLGILPPVIMALLKIRPAVRMLRLAALSLAILGTMLPVVGSSYIGTHNLTDAGDKPVQLLLLNGTGKNSVPDIAVVFWTGTPTMNKLKWNAGTSSGSLTEDLPSRCHRFILRDLPPDTVISYQINGGEIRHFRTPSLTVPLRFAVASDAHFGAGNNRPDLTTGILKRIAGPENGYSIFLFAGDLVEHGHNDTHWREAISALTTVTSSVPALFAAGNHDTVLGGLKRFQNYLGTGGREDALWRKVSVSGVHFFVLDREWNDDSIQRERKAWLEKGLSSIPSQEWVVVMSHAYCYASGSTHGCYPRYDDRTAINELVPLFEKYDVDLVLSGHAHQFELLQKNGVTYVICGTVGGAPGPPRTYTSPASVWYASGRYGFVEVSVQDRALIVFRDASGSVLKTFSVER